MDHLGVADRRLVGRGSGKGIGPKGKGLAQSHPVRFLNNAGLSLNILDPTGTPVTQVITNTDGWPTPNPLTVQMSITNTAGMTLTNPALVLSIDSPSQLGEYEGRFYVMETNGFDAGLYGVSGVQYKVITDTASLAISQTIVLTAQVWIQPSITTTLEFAAELYTDSAAIGQDDPLGQATKLVDVPQAKIHPIVFVPGYLGTFPPVHGGKLDPLTQIYDNLIAGLERAGYEAGLAGSGATLIPFGYDWRQPLGDTGRVALRNDIEAIQNSSNQRDYVDYSQVDIIAHSAGGLVSRAYIEDSSANNDQNVNRLITLATPHKGTLAAYRGWYGGDPTGILPINEFRSLLNVLLVCKGLAVQSVFEEDEALAEEDYYTYFRTEVPSVPDLLPQASGLPQPYLTARTPTGCSGGPDYCYGTPPNPFLNDLNSSGGQYEVTKLQNVPITSSYRLDRPDLTEGRYEVDPPPTSPPNDQPELWRYGKINESYVNNVSGDIVVPDFSGDLTDVVSYSNIQGQDETIGATVSQLPHVTINNEPIMVRRVISYVTGIDVPENFWQEEWSRSDYDLDDAIAFLSCNPIFRQLVTDPLGRRVGFSLEDGQVINDVSEAFVSEAGSIPQLILLPRIEGEYQVQGINELPGDF